jgi:dihydroflavonol-4-reductase
MRIAVVGATGMLGRHVARHTLRAGHELIALYRNPRLLNSLADLLCDARQADLDDVDSLRLGLRGADAVIHCAAYYPGAPKSIGEELATAARLSNNFYEACAGQELKKIVYVGAAIALPRSSDGKPSDGSQSYSERPHDQNAYLQVKWAQDALALQKAAEGMPVVVGIPSMTFGEYDPGNSTGSFVIEMANRTLPGYVAGKRNVVYAGDAGRGLVRVCEDGRPSERYLICGENLTMQRLMAQIATITEAPEPKEIPLAVAKLVSAWQILKYKHLRGPVPKVSASAIAVMSSGQYLDGSKATRELGYQPEVSVDEALRRAFEWFKSQGKVKIGSLKSAAAAAP